MDRQMLLQGGGTAWGTNRHIWESYLFKSYRKCVRNHL